MSFRKFPRNRKARRVLITLVFVLPSIVAAIILVAINKKNENDVAQIFLALVSIILALPTALDYILKDNFDLMPTIYNKAIQLDEQNAIPKFSYGDKYALASIRNFNKEDVSVALLGVFTESQYEELNKKSSNWRKLYYFTGLNSKDACKLYLNNNGSLNYEIVSAHGVSKPRKVEFKDIKLNLVNNEQEFYLAYYIDVYYKLYFVKFMIINDQSVDYKININK